MQHELLELSAVQNGQFGSNWLIERLAGQNSIHPSEFDPLPTWIMEAPLNENSFSELVPHISKR